MLRGGEKAGAIAALNDIVDKKVSLTDETDEDSLTEAINSSNTIDLISDDEFNKIIDGHLKAIEKVKKIRKEGPRENPLKKFGGDYWKNDLTAEDRANILKDKIEKDTQSELQRLHNLNKYSSSHKPSTSFKHDLRLAIQDQIETYKEQRKSWAALNRRTAHTAVMKQGNQIITQDEPKKPSIRVYLDCSGSFNQDDITKEENFMSGVAKFERDKEIEKTVIKYFSNNLHDDFRSARDEGGTSA